MSLLRFCQKLAIAGHDHKNGCLPKDEHMKTTKLVIIGSLFLLVSVGAARAQSLADYAREAKKNKTETSSASHHYDNDNLPTNGDLSVVGPPPATDIRKMPLLRMRKPRLLPRHRLSIRPPQLLSIRRRQMSWRKISRSRRRKSIG